METLEEGKEYEFYVEKLLPLPDGKYYILVDNWNRKYLLPQQYYIDYPISVGTNIFCHVNKINCNGKIFLEPRHPIYKINDEDIFTLYELQQRIKQRTKEPYYVILAHNQKYDKAVVLNHTEIDLETLPADYKCKVVKVKKAELQLIALEIVKNH